MAKIANSIAKKNPQFGGVVDLSGADADKFLKDFDVADIWGIGRRYAQFLKSEDKNDHPQLDLWEASGFERMREKLKIETALDLKNSDDKWLRKHLTVKGQRIAWELRGISCLPLELFEKPKKGLCCSRSFGQGIKTIEDLRQAVAMHTARAGEKLRRQKLGGDTSDGFRFDFEFSPQPGRNLFRISKPPNADSYFLQSGNFRKMLTHFWNESINPVSSIAKPEFS
ncbi:MAG: hypothetical protein HC846_04190 [Blastocatellia bacterium]|nr:hypothetical protein [Blastocatellia bacterium]